MIDTSDYFQCIGILEQTSDWVSERRLGIPQLGHVAPYKAVAESVTPGIGGDYLADRLVGPGSTAAIADSIALELRSPPKVEW